MTRQAEAQACCRVSVETRRIRGDPSPEAEWSSSVLEGDRGEEFVVAGVQVTQGGCAEGAGGAAQGLCVAEQERFDPDSGPWQGPMLVARIGWTGVRP